ncbi:MAG: PD-(D/E)XK nuclease family protein [Bernardetiaceae bacterium]
MPLSFLEEVAQGLTQKFGQDLARCYLVLPSRRACMYLKLYLSERAREVVFAPHILSMEDFIHGLAQVEVEESTSLLFDLFESYRSFDDQKETSLERFAPLGTIILRDFNLMDRELLDAKALFAYMNDLQAIERWGEMFGQDIQLQTGSSIPGYHRFWQQLQKTYFDFTQRLNRQNKAYSGMAYRLVCEQIESIIQEKDIFHVAFIGFSQFSKSEEQIIRKLIKHKRASTYWDADHYYLDDPFHEAGDYLRTYRDRFWEKELLYCNRHIAEEPKTITFVAVDHAIMQAKLVGQLLQETLSQIAEEGAIADFKNRRNHMAILLPDESLLMPILYALPEDHPELDLSQAINITMGVSLRNTPLFTLIQNVFLMQENRSWQGGKSSIYHKDIARMLQHPYLYLPERDEESPLFKMEKENQIYVPLQELEAYPINGKFYKRFFKSWQKDNIHSVFVYFYDLIEFLANRFSGSKFSLDNEYLFQFYTLLKRLQNILEANQEPIAIATFKQFLFEAIRETKIPFTGEPINPIQIMGMLESRALDFDHVIILSCNEGTLPQGKSYNSVIPFDIKKQFGLPTHLASESSFAYTFYRLLHRAKRITLIYTTDPDLTGGGEPSRYLSQIEHEMADLPHITIQKSRVNLPLPQRKKNKIQVAKTEQVQENLYRYLTEEGLTPTHISSYLKDPLSFFEQKILHLYQGEGVSEELETLAFGNLIHQSIEALFEPFITKAINENTIRTILQTTDLTALVTDILTQNAGGILQDRGKTYLLKQTAVGLLEEFLEEQSQEPNYQLLAQEYLMQTIIPVKVSQDLTLPVKLCGTADRIVYTQQGELRLIDFKTGKLNAAMLKIETIHALLHEPQKSQALQLILYHYLLLRLVQAPEQTTLFAQLPTLPSPDRVAACFLFFKALDEKYQTYEIKEKPSYPDRFMQEVEAFIELLVKDMLDASKPFSRDFEISVEDLAFS